MSGCVWFWLWNSEGLPSYNHTAKQYTQTFDSSPQMFPDRKYRNRILTHVWSAMPGLAVWSEFRESLFPSRKNCQCFRLKSKLNHVSEKHLSQELGEAATISICIWSAVPNLTVWSGFLETSLLSWTDTLRMTCKSQISHALYHTLLYRLFYSKCDHNSQTNSLEEDLKPEIKTINSQGNRLLK